MSRPEPIPLPPHAHVPGRNARHDDAVFAQFHDSVRPGMGAKELARTLAWRAGWVYLNRGFYWEAHEVLEPVWMALPDGSAERQFTQALIQLANAALKHRMARENAVRRLCGIVEDHLVACGASEQIMGLEVSAVRDRLAILRGGGGLEILAD